MTTTDFLREQPFRIFFPLGLLLAWAGVGHWLLHAVTLAVESLPADQAQRLSWLALLPDYRPVFHAIAQVEGFMTCFAAGFLFTMLPRRTAAPPAEAWQIAVVAACLPAAVALAWAGRLSLSQGAWTVGLLVMAGFVLPRLSGRLGQRRPPNAFVWLPVALFAGVAGALLIGAYGILGDSALWLHDLGRALVLQGMFIALVCGVGSLVLPMFLYGQPPPDAGDTPGDRRERAGHLLAALLLLAAFVGGLWYPRAGAVALSLVTAVVLLRVGRIAALPRAPGLHRRLLWLAAWAIPAGYAALAVFPAHRAAMLHVVFLAGFAMLALAVASQVVFGHGGRPGELAGNPPMLVVTACGLALALAGRVMVSVDPAHFVAWLGLAAGAFLVGSLAWAAWTFPLIAKR
ncbi:MAG: NnrS family protein [Proteobacteria bacterium]|nr:NnrS family protein [Pseudomonadota bacterium]